jgi:hypothetical protein
MVRYRKYKKHTYRGYKKDNKKRNFTIVVITFVIFGVYLFGGFSFAGLESPKIFPAHLGWTMAGIVFVLFVIGIIAAYQIIIGRLIRF